MSSSPKMDRIEEAIAKLASSHLILTEKLDELINRVTNLENITNPSPSPSSSSAMPIPQIQSANPHRLKLDVPRFDGSDPSGWVFKITQFFEYHATPEAKRLTVASFYMDGPALAWFQWMARNHQLTTWSGFLQAIEARFAQSPYEDPTGLLFKLTQKGTVREYLAQFEALANRITGLSPASLLSCFISGLEPDVRREVQALQPSTLVHAAGLARLQEEKILEHRRAFRQRPHPSPPQHSPTPLSIVTPTPSPPLLPSPPKPPPLPIRRLTPEEIASRRERGLCFHCDEKFTRGHRCPSRFLLLLADEDPPDNPNIDNPDPLMDPNRPETPIINPMTQDPTEPTQAQISLHALSGYGTPETLRVTGRINLHHVTILVDGGSTHNFVQERLVKTLGLNPQPTPTLRVLVGNGNTVECSQVCSEVTVHIQGVSFSVNLHVLPLYGADVVFGVPWLKALGPVLTDYNNLVMKFMHDDRIIELKGSSETPLTAISPPQLRRLVQTQGASEFFHIRVCPSPEHTPNNSPNTQSAILDVINQFPSLFQPPTKLPPSRATNHHIHLLPNSTPVNVRPYRYPNFQKEEIESQVNTMLQNGIICPSNSPYSSPVLLVKKRDGTWRFCVDYRALNALTVKDRFPIPTIDELLDELGGAYWYSKLDLLQGYHQILMAPEDVNKTVFRTHHGHYEFLVMPFGLCSAPSSFQATMNAIFGPCLRKFLIVFFDDILVYSKTFHDHLEHLRNTFQIISDNGFVLKKSKCSFAIQQVEYLGHVVSARGVEPVPEKVLAVQQWPPPRSVRHLRGFLGLSGFYRRFIKGYATLATPLTALLATDQFGWTPEAEDAFNRLKEALCKAPVLALPDFAAPFIIETDASGAGMGAILSQHHHPLAFFSKPFCSKLLRASAYVRELAAITAAVKKWRQYLLGHHFSIITDHRSLKELMAQAVQTPEQQVYLARLMGYDYTIHYRAGKHNSAADALSRLPEPPPNPLDTTQSQIFMLTIPNCVFLQELKRELFTNEEFQAKKKQIEEEKETPSEFIIKDEFILHQGRIWLPRNLPLLPTIITEFHATPTGGHMGIMKTMARVRENFTWASMKEDIQRHITNCITCQQIKTDHRHPPGLLCPLPVPARPWEDLSLDFISGLPPYRGNSVILVIIDRFSKGIHLGSLPSHHTAFSVAQLFMELSGKLHGMPRSLVSDRDPLFLSRFWQELFKMSGTKLRMSSAYHPQSDGQTEAMNKIVEQYLRAFVH